jgi:hypothetical protein
MTDTGTARIRLLLRSSAVVIAVLALLDPALTRPVPRATVALRGPASSDSAWAAPLATAIRRAHDLIDPRYRAEAVSVLVGATGPLPDSVTGPAVVLLPPARRPWVAFADVEAATQVGPGSTTLVRARVVLRPAGATQLALTLRDGARAVDSLLLPLPPGTVSIDTTLLLVPVDSGLRRLTVQASLPGTAAAARWEALLRVRTAPWRVLAYDPRPSWLATFVRRHLAADPRFSVTHRVRTAPGLTRASGDAPASLATAEALRGADVVVIGAPEALEASEIAALGQHLRAGGSLLLLPDSTGGEALAALSDQRGWRLVTGEQLGRDPWGRRLGAGRVLLPPRPQRLEPLTVPALAWRAAVGPGTLLVHAAPDAWQRRDTAQGEVLAVWAALVEQAALEAQATPEDPATRRRDRAPDIALLSAWARATGGDTLAVDALDEMSATIDRVAGGAGTPARWHPMRSPWWLLLFGLALSAEWALRRRRGLA